VDKFAPPTCVVAVPADAKVPTVRTVVGLSALKSVGSVAVAVVPIPSKSWIYGVVVDNDTDAFTLCSGKAASIKARIVTTENTFEKAFVMFVLLKQKTHKLKNNTCWGVHLLYVPNTSSNRVREFDTITNEGDFPPIVSGLLLATSRSNFSNCVMGWTQNLSFT